MSEDTAHISNTLIHNEWTIYLVSILVLIGLYFVQKYAHLIDRKLNQAGHTNSVWEGKPWPLSLAISLGVIIYLYNVFSPEDMQQYPVNWRWPEWALVVCFVILFAAMTFESISHFGVRLGLIRLLIYGVLAALFFIAGFLMGLLIAAVIALGALIYFIWYWRKLLVIK